MAIMPQDDNSESIQVLRPGTTNLVASTGTASNVPAVSNGVEVLRIVADAAIHYSIIGTATTSSVYLPAGTVEYIRADGGDVVSVLGTANVYVTEMD